MLSDAVATLVARYDNIKVETVASLAEALARSEAFAPEHLELHVRDPEALLARVRNAGSVFIGGSAVVGDYAAGATHVLPTGGLARSSGGLGLEMFMKPLQVVRATAAGAAAAAEVVGPIARAEGLPLHAAAAERAWWSDRERASDAPARPDASRTGAPDAVPLPDAFAPYTWAATVAEVAARHGLDPVQVLKFDQNTPPLPGVAQVPLAESFATLNHYPDGLVPRTARGRGRLRRREPARASAGSRSSSAPAPTT